MTARNSLVVRAGWGWFSRQDYGNGCRGATFRVDMARGRQREDAGQ